MKGKASSSHNHDDRYYTESEINTKISTINNSLNSLNSNLKWKLLKSVTGTTSISFPDNFEELHIEVANTVNNVYAFNIPKIALTSTAKCYKIGSFSYSQGYYGNAIEINISTTCMYVITFLCKLWRQQYSN